MVKVLVRLVPTGQGGSQDTEYHGYGVLGVDGRMMEGHGRRTPARVMGKEQRADYSYAAGPLEVAVCLAGRSWSSFSARAANLRMGATSCSG